MQEEKSKSKFVKIGSLWRTKKEDAKIRASGLLWNSTKIVLISREKKKEIEPDFDLCVSQEISQKPKEKNNDL